jgi:hypothetical protein
VLDQQPGVTGEEKTMKSLVQESVRTPTSMFRCAALAVLSLGIPLAAKATEQPGSALAAFAQQSSAKKSFSPLVERVRRATAKYRDINVMINEGGWARATPCVSGPNSGAMGVHFVKEGRVGDGILRADEPEALIYEPMSNGAMRLVGVEFIELADVWNATSGGKQPTLEGHLMNLVTAPNRYTLPAFYEIHVWAWEDNPNGSFADWNTEVSCDKQPTE